MRLFAILLLISSLHLPIAYSQSTAPNRYAEINYYLAEALECKDLNDIKTQIITQQAAIVEEQRKAMTELRTQIALLEENYQIATHRATLCATENTNLHNHQQALTKRIHRLERGRNTWRTISLGLGAALGISLQLK